jgi:hypothetical protein
MPAKRVYYLGHELGSAETVNRALDLLRLKGFAHEREQFEQQGLVFSEGRNGFFVSSLRPEPGGDAA